MLPNAPTQAKYLKNLSEEDPSLFYVQGLILGTLSYRNLSDHCMIRSAIRIHHEAIQVIGAIKIFCRSDVIILKTTLCSLS